MTTARSSPPAAAAAAALKGFRVRRRRRSSSTASGDEFFVIGRRRFITADSDVFPIVVGAEPFEEGTEGGHAGGDEGEVVFYAAREENWGQRGQ